MLRLSVPHAYHESTAEVGLSWGYWVTGCAQALDAVRAAREDYASILAELGFVPRAYLEHLRGGRGEQAAAAAAAADCNAGNTRVVKAALCAGLYPNVLRVRHPEQVPTTAPAAHYCPLPRTPLPLTMSRTCLAHRVIEASHGGAS